MYSKYDVRLIIRKLERLFLVEYLIYIIGIIVFIYIFIKATKLDKKSEERNQDLSNKLRNVDHAKEIAQAHGYILESIDKVVVDGSPLVKLKKEINSELETISEPCEVTLNLSVRHCHVSTSNHNSPDLVFDDIEYPLSGYDLKRIEESVVDGSHFSNRNESGDWQGYKISPK